MNQISELRDIVLKLAPTGEKGFEGLMAVIMTEITKTIFCLAKSGSQKGKDGQSFLNSGVISFEGKRYDGPVPKNEVLSKITEIAINDNGNIDLWILGSTGTVSSQDVDTITAVGEHFAIGTLILDWSTAGLPPLATLLAMAPAATASFLSTNTGIAEAEILAKLTFIQAHNQFFDRTKELNIVIDQPSISPAYALLHNKEFLDNAFRNVGKARAIFGQALAPGDIGAFSVLDRATLRQNLADLIFANPNGEIVAILGGDGNGKSWLFGQCWLHHAPQILTIVLVPENIKTPLTQAIIEELLISTLIEQTGSREKEVLRNRWRKHFDRWKRIKNSEIPRLIVFIDGLNQSENIQWVKAINIFNQTLSELGGKLVFSCRTPFYQSNLSGLIDCVRSVEVPGWTNLELEQLLADQGTAIDKLPTRIVEFLRNPRILAVGAQLFKNGEIEGFTELSISRLLFEHIRTGSSSISEPLSIDNFVCGVRDHADEIIKRLKESNVVDLKIFERSVTLTKNNSYLNDRLAVISEGRIFEEVSGDSTLYTLKEESMPLALGLSLLSTAKRAQRNQHNIIHELSKILDPISALDNTAEVLISALIVSVLSDNTPPDITAALGTAFVTLQNIDASHYEEFRALVRQAPFAFLQALESATILESIASNLSWLTKAFLESRNEIECWAAITKMSQRWLSMYSLSPARKIINRSTDSDKRVVELQKQEAIIKAKLENLSLKEKALINELILEERGDYSKLNRIAFEFLAGKPLKEFGDAFRNWCFAASLNGGFYNEHEEFDDLIQFNRIDWEATQNAIIKASEVLHGDNTSRTGQWALVYLLHATGASVDAKQAKEISEYLTKDNEKYSSWSLVEDWCASDPCDPTSERPNNIDVTLQNYMNIDVTKLKNTIGQASEDHFFDGARVGLARFEPTSVVGIMRRFAADVITRANGEFRIATFLLENHTAALDSTTASLFVNRASKLAEEALVEEDKHKELFVASQYALMIAFPHMTGDQQLAALIAYPRCDNILLPLCALMQDCDTLKYEVALQKAYIDNDTISQFRLMAFGESTDIKVTDISKIIIGELVKSTATTVRLCALGLIRRLNDPALLRVVVESDWSANALNNTSERLEIWYGSEVLTLAAACGLISASECIDRIGLSGYSNFMQKIGREAAIIVGDRFEVALEKAAHYSTVMTLPDIEYCIEGNNRPNLYSIEEKSNPQESISDSFKRQTETSDAWYERQARNLRTVEKFEKELTAAGAQLIVQSVTVELLEEIYKILPEKIRQWYQFCVDMDLKALQRVYNIALLLAQITAHEDQIGAVALFEKLAKIDPFVRVTYGKSRINTDAMAIWSASDGSTIQALRFRRLDQARTDHVLANEVLAAIRSGKEENLREYVQDRLTRPEPAHIARAIMVAGFCEDTPWALETLKTYQNCYGFISEAHKAAKYAMERLLWSKHWGKLMYDSSNKIDLWRYAIILTAIVDGRFDSGKLENNNNPFIKRYGATFNTSIRHRIGKWKDKRNKTLFGMKTPNEVFLT